MALEKRDIKRLRGLAHDLKPVMHIGKGGLSEEVVASVEQALAARELIKVKFLETSGFDKSKTSQELADALKAELIGVIGFVVILYRRNSEVDRYSLDQ